MKGLTDSEKITILTDCTTTKKCTKCNEDKLLSKCSHYKNKKNNLWYFGNCYNCNYKRKLLQHGNSVASYNATQTYKENFTIEGRAAMLRNRCKQRAKRNGYKFSLTKKHIIKLLTDGKCQKTNIKLIIDDSSYNPYAPSIDRINNDEGYTNNNIQVTCMIYNFCKNKFTEEQVSKFFKDIQL